MAAATCTRMSSPCPSSFPSLTPYSKSPAEKNDYPRWHFYTQVTRTWSQETVSVILSFYSRQWSLIPTRAHLIRNFPNMKRLRCWASREKTNVQGLLLEPLGQVISPASRTRENASEVRCPNWTLKGKKDKGMDTCEEDGTFFFKTIFFEFYSFIL